jgi:hypothetical protein
VLPDSKKDFLETGNTLIGKLEPDKAAAKGTPQPCSSRSWLVALQRPSGATGCETTSGTAASSCST